MDELLKTVWPIFRAEAAEYVEALTADVLALEKGGGAERLDTIRRNAHSLKGSAASLGFFAIEKLAHGAEGANAVAELARESARRFLEIGDELKPDTMVSLAELLVSLAAALAELGDEQVGPPVPPPQPTPSSAPAPSPGAAPAPSPRAA